MFEWKNAYSCGIDSIDDHHKVLFQLGADLFDVYQHSDKEVYPPQFGKVFKGLQEYTIYHFMNEEKFMTLHNYPWIEDHKREHALFLEYLTKISMELNTKEYNEVVEDMLKFVSKWIFHHIQHSDFKLTDYVISIDSSS